MTSTSVDQDAEPAGAKETSDRAGWWASDAVAAGVIALVSLVGPMLLLATTDLGVHASNDSLTYLGAADRLVHGDGWTYPFGDVGAPVTLFPPLYPLLLAVPAALDVDPFVWVRWQNTLLLAVLAGSVGWVVFRETRAHVLAAVLASLLVQLGVPTIHPYARIWSETLFFPLVVVALAATARHVGGGRTVALILGAAATGTAMVTRYAGLALFVTCCALLVVWPGRPIRARVRSAAIFGLVAAIPSALWVLRNSFTSGTLTGDNQLIHELRGAAVVNGVQRIVRWILPARPPGLLHDVVFGIAVVALAFLVVALVWSLVRGGPLRRISPSAIVPVCVAYVVVHFTFIVVANAFSTRAPPFNHRILGPAFAPLVIAVVVIGDAIWRSARDRLDVRVAVGVAGVSLLALSVLTATEAMPSIFGAPAGSAAEYRAFDRTLEPLVPSGARLFSTRPNVAWFLLRQPVTSLPRSCRGGRVLPNPSFPEELAALGQDLAEEPRAVIVFRRSRECAPFSVPLLKRELRLARVGPPGPPGAVWVLSGPSASG
jgi:hypothetical protein